MVIRMRPVKTAVIGCGAISDIYLTNMINKYATLDVVACCASHRENAEKKAAQYAIRAASTDEILQDSEVELIVVLTPAPTHYELVKRALLAGKHVYTEKPLATELWQARELLTLAEEKGMRLGSAPETFLGSALQTGRKALDDGLLGQISSFHVVANRDLTVLASLFKFLRMPGGGIGYDYGVYYLTALVSLLGPMAKVYAQVGNLQPVRHNMIPFSPEYGQDYAYTEEAQINAVLTTKSGVVGTFSLNGDSAMQDQAYFTIQGTGGIRALLVPHLPLCAAEDRDGGGAAGHAALHRREPRAAPGFGGLRVLPLPRAGEVRLVREDRRALGALAADGARRYDHLRGERH